MDKMAPEEMDRLVPFSQLPVIITYRPPAERMEKREALISMHMAFQAIRLGAAYLDLGMDMPQEMRQEIIREKGKTKVIISCHFTDTTPSAKYLGKTMQIMAGTGADTVKIVTMASNARDCMTVLDLIASGKELGVDVSAFCMGAAGRWSRIACLLMGGCMSYASLSEAEKTAEGQIPAAQMRCILEILQYGT
jgi:3-dehydroquinate dehydratase type I